MSSFVVDSRTGLDRGFQTMTMTTRHGFKGLSELQAFQVMSRLLMKYENPSALHGCWSGTASAPMTAVEWLSRREDKPWFLWIHYFEPHAPYEGPDTAVSHRDLLSNPEA